MSTSARPLAASSSSTTAPPAPQERSYFEQQRELLLREIGTSFEHVLANINKLNRSLEAVTAVGNEFSSVEALWSTFENVMGKDAAAAAATEKERDLGDVRDGEEETGGSVHGEFEGVDGDGDESTAVLEQGQGRRK